MDWEEVKRLFHEAVRDRRALEGAPGAVRAEVEALLRAHEAAPPESPLEGPGSFVGRYKLLQQIGEGGFGVVWMAEQTEPVRRKVALKVLKAGMDTGQVVARFEAERQALALMDHEHIAKVLDAGATPGGRPYFVMELVRGVPVTAYCDEAQLDTRARLELFVQVCSAVQHAHQKGIIHRDLKPSNVLVTLHDGRPVPKVIDFGIAKAIDRRLTEKTLFTEFRQMIGTPEYMAPEQAELSGLDVDTRADIYSLGVLLYELLTGTKPFDLGQKAFDEVLRTIRETDPPRPSTRVSTMGDALVTVAGKRRTAPERLGRLLRGDVDWIVMKALEKDRSRRYETANGLASDIRRHLADEPVLAAPPGAAHRLRKYVRRHRLGVAAAALVLAGVVAGGALAFAGMREAEAEAAGARRAAAAELARRDEARAARASEGEQRERAQAGAAAARKETLRARTVTGLVDGMLEAADPHVQKGAGFTVRQLLEDFDRSLGDRLAGEPEVEATIRYLMGRAYLGLGVADRAAPHIRAALEIRRRIFGDANADTVQAWCDHIFALVSQGRTEEAERGARDVLATWRGAGNPEWIAKGLINLSLPLLHQHRLDEALACLRDARSIVESRGDLPAKLREMTAIQLGYAHHNKGEFREARRWMEEALRVMPPGSRAAGIRAHVALLSMLLGELDRAETLFDESLAEMRRFLEEDHPQIAELIGRKAEIAHARGQLGSAEALARESLGRLRSRGEEGVFVVNLLGLIQLDRRDPAAEATFREAMEIERKAGREELPHFQCSLSNLGMALEYRGDLAAAEECQARALAGCRRLGVIEGMVRALDGIGRISEARGDLAGAEKHYREALEVAEQSPEAAFVWGRVLLLELAYVTEGQGRADEAEGLYRRALDGAAGTLLAWSEWLFACRRMAKGDLPGAEAHLRRSLDLYRGSVGDEHSNTVEMRVSLAAILDLRGEREAAAAMLRELAAEGEGPRRVLTPPLLKQEWLSRHAMSLLGGALAEQGKYAEAEPLLVAGFDGMTPPAEHVARKREALERVVKLYEAWGKQDEAARWRERR